MINFKINPQGKFFAYNTQTQCAIPENPNSLTPTDFLFENLNFRLTIQDVEYKNVTLFCLGTF